MPKEIFNRDFKGVWIPREIWLDENLSAIDKVILAEIDSLGNSESGCYASNKYLAEFCGCSEAKVSKAVSKLKKMGLIEVISFDGRQRKLQSRLVKNTRQTSKKYKADLEKVQAINIDSNISINLDKEERKKASKTNSTTFNEIIESYTQNSDLQISLKEFIKMRALIKKKLTDHALKLLLNKLDRLAISDTEKIDIVNQSITNSWAGFFEVRQQTKQEPQRPIIQETEDQRRERELNEAIKAKFYGKR